MYTYGTEVYLEPDEVWKYYKENESRLLIEDDFEIIAENEEFDVTIGISPSSKGGLCIEVSVGGCIEQDDFVYSESECTAEVSRVYEYYLCYGDYTELGDKLTIEEKIEEREEELKDAAKDYLWAITDNPKDLTNADLLDDINEHFLEYLARKWNIDIRRPMVLEDEDGNDFYTDFPYKQMVFEDEDNPIYKK